MSLTQNIQMVNMIWFHNPLTLVFYMLKNNKYFFALRNLTI
jgi:hypothetical protein